MQAAFIFIQERYGEEFIHECTLALIAIQTK